MKQFGSQKKNQHRIRLPHLHIGRIHFHRPPSPVASNIVYKYFSSYLLGQNKKQVEAFLSVL